MVKDQNLCVDMVNLENLISIFNVTSFKFKDQCLIPQFRLSLQGMNITGFR